MSENSSPLKSGIQSLDDYYEALELYAEAKDRINSGGTGMGYSGVHYISKDESTEEFLDRHQDEE